MRIPTSQSGLQKGPQKNTKLHQKLAKHVTVRKFSRGHTNRSLLLICSRKLFHIITDKGCIFTTHFLSYSVIANQILKLFAKKYLFFNSLAGKFPMVFDSLTSDALVSSKNRKSVCKVRRKLMKKAVPDHVPVKDVIRLGDVGLLKKKKLG